MSVLTAVRAGRTSRPWAHGPARWLVALVFALAPLAAHAAIDTYAFSSEENASRYHALIAELRCPVCLSSNLSGSDSPISADLRREVYRLVEEGKTDQEVRDYMQARYGDYILYRPRLTPFAIALYALPVLLIGVGAFVILRLVRRRRSDAGGTADGPVAVPEAELAALLARHGSPLAAATDSSPAPAAAGVTGTAVAVAADGRHGTYAERQASEQKGTPAT